jgi:hypothetical protein
MRAPLHPFPPLFARNRVVHLARALLVSLLALVLTSLLLTTGRVTVPTPWSVAVTQAA